MTFDGRVVPERGRLAEPIPFPKAKKRGPKVRRGPSAEIVVFPASDPMELYLDWICLGTKHEREDFRKILPADSIRQNNTIAEIQELIREKKARLRAEAFALLDAIGWE